MRLGCCASLDVLDAVRRAGFAYVEPPRRGPGARRRRRDGLRADPPAHRGCGIAPPKPSTSSCRPTTPVVGPKRDLPALRAYVGHRDGTDVRVGRPSGDLWQRAGPSHAARIRSAPGTQPDSRLPGAGRRRRRALRPWEIVIEPLWREGLRQHQHRARGRGRRPPIRKLPGGGAGRLVAHGARARASDEPGRVA